MLGISRTSYYCPSTKQHAKDKQLVEELLEAHGEHPFYGTRRLAIHLGWSRKKAKRIRILAKVVIPTPGKHRHHSKALQPEIPAPTNALKAYAIFRNVAKPQAGQDYSGMTKSGAWVQDFTHLKFRGEEHYLAVVLDLRTRQVVGWRLGLRHSSELTHAAVLDALSKHPSPTILHSDQGSEYLSHKHRLLCEKLEIRLSCSTKSSPWQNGFMERWFGNFKQELGKTNQLKDVAELHETIAMQIYYYNHKRIHTAFGMSPAAYAASLKPNTVLKA